MRTGRTGYSSRSCDEIVDESLNEISVDSTRVLHYGARVSQPTLDLSHIFELESHGADTYLGTTPDYPWGRVYGGLAIAQALWAATQTVQPDHLPHSLHAYFILGGELGEPIRYEVDRVRNGRSFTTRRVVARQSGGAILTLGCSFQRGEAGPVSQSAVMPQDVPRPDGLSGSVHSEFDSGFDRRDVPGCGEIPQSRAWVRFPEALGEDPRLHACGLAYVSDASPMGAVRAAHPDRKNNTGAWDDAFMGASLDHAMWFHRPVRANDWMLIDMTGHGVAESRGLATGPVFASDGTHIATIAQEGLLRRRRRP